MIEGLLVGLGGSGLGAGPWDFPWLPPAKPSRQSLSWALFPPTHRAVLLWPGVVLS